MYVNYFIYMYIKYIYNYYNKANQDLKRLINQ
jgi:hypothetical protein